MRPSAGESWAYESSVGSAKVPPGKAERRGFVRLTWSIWPRASESVKTVWPRYFWVNDAQLHSSKVIALVRREGVCASIRGEAWSGLHAVSIVGGFLFRSTKGFNLCSGGHSRLEKSPMSVTLGQG